MEHVTQHLFVMMKRINDLLQQWSVHTADGLIDWLYQYGCHRGQAKEGHPEAGKYILLESSERIWGRRRGVNVKSTLGPVIM